MVQTSCGTQTSTLRSWTSTTPTRLPKLKSCRNTTFTLRHMLALRPSLCWLSARHLTDHVVILQTDVVRSQSVGRLHAVCVAVEPDAAVGRSDPVGDEFLVLSLQDH